MPSTAPPAAGSQGDGDGDGLVVVEQERRQRRPRLELVAAGDAGAGVDRIAEFAKPVDVAAERPLADVQPLGQVAARPGAMRLQERHEAEHPPARVRHAELAVIADRK